MLTGRKNDLLPLLFCSDPILYRFKVDSPLFHIEFFHMLIPCIHIIILIWNILSFDVCRLKLTLVLLYLRFQDCFSIALPRMQLINTFPLNVLQYVMMGLLGSQEVAWGRNVFAQVIYHLWFWKLYWLNHIAFIIMFLLKK